MAGAMTAQLSGLTLGGGRTQGLQGFEGLRANTPVVRSNTVRVVQPRRGSLQVQAARVANVEIPNKKRIETSLTYIYGIGPTAAKVILETTGIENKRTYDLSEEELTTLRSEVDNYTTEGDLRRYNALNIKRLKEIQCYRGKRHQAGLPCRGQKTKTNARQCKNNRFGRR
uniref:30S ribosomal protein S13, chloroplastic n=1 Tax=Tetraselmis chuii TaxID=63592 RepID=A0A7S1SV42_9CHLO|mmetsp:Transcript_3080/g.5603  ORF Transcript_3080/g.5603 Transcript_3080/m.5603 type:complete len:170 (+) Transcript_3080:130-639(+)|eukprot:CAMPEP_0168611940 /NCGR_PEP_ID=MMETSP0449_2-20121227/2636_1 /TAXON_ID=1082188 /ORGANISM="Strombidium rassoulzadegani, Strain ras09" /LENGTH=169 /DNA_ID=CAMNT_0008652441 /DNA_START=20 /DNA_END=529 /DNA_ORIENTATION=+